MKEYLQSPEEVCAAVAVNPAAGLDAAQVQTRLERDGKNRLAEKKRDSMLKRFLAQLCDPMIIILLVAAAISGFTAVYAGESFADVIIILAVVLINATLGVVQENKAEKAIAALREMTAATCKVLRDGKTCVVRSEELAVGDIVLLEAGDSVPADARLLEVFSLKAEEAALTGESVPVNKSPSALPVPKNGDIPLGDRSNMLYMGTGVVYGRGSAVVVATGMNTEMGKIAAAISEASEGKTPLQRKLSQLSKFLTWLVVGICALIFAVDLLRNLSHISGETILDTFMVAVSLAVAAIPEGLAAVVTIVLSMGVTKMSKRGAVIRRLSSVETLGCTGVICSDKTGTLTQNKMTVVERYGDDETLLQTAMALASDATLDEQQRAVGEPTECALVNDAAANELYRPALEEANPRIGEAPFDSMRKMMSTVHRQKDGGIVQYTKGAPDEVLKHCTHLWRGGKSVPITDKEREAILDAMRTMAKKALRVLAAAMRTYEAPPADFEAQTLEQSLCFIGLSGMIDPVRPEVKDAIDTCRAAGIRPVMITGDHRDTAVAIAQTLGILKDESCAITGAELELLSDKELEKKITHYSVYARVQPEHKVRIVKAWQKHGKITAMTGDGVNDAPSIKSADIGVGMGITGTDVTKNVADMVLSDDNFATIVLAVEEGRRIYDNIRKAIQFLLASNLSEVLSIFAATLLGFTILKPVHLLWINLITDSLPALALGTEKAEGDVMRRPPRRAADGVFADGMGFDIALQGILVTLITLAAYFIGHFMESGRFEIAESPDGMTMAFLALSMAEIFHSFNMRSRTASIFQIRGQNRALWGAMLLSLLLTAAVIFIPALAAAFGFETISLDEYLVAMGLSLTVIPCVEISKLFRRMRARQSR